MSDEQPPVTVELEHLKRVHLEPGDALVLQHPDNISNADAGRLYQYLSRKFPGHEVFILTAGAQLGVVRPVPDGEPQPITVHVNGSTLGEGDILKAVEKVLRQYGLGGGYDGRNYSR